MKYFKINKNLSDDFKKELVLFAKSNKDKYYYHNSTISNEYTNLNFLFTNHSLYDIIEKMFPIKGNTTAILNVPASKNILPHTDGVNLKRTSVVIFPLWPDADRYAPCYIEGEKIPFMNCYAFNTQKTHWINNNSWERFSLQIFYDIPIEELYEQYSRVDGLV